MLKSPWCRSKSRGLWPDDRDKLPARRSRSHERDRPLRPEAHSNSKYHSSQDDCHGGDGRRAYDRHGRSEPSSRDEGLNGRQDDSYRNRWAYLHDVRVRLCPELPQKWEELGSNADLSQVARQHLSVCKESSKQKVLFVTHAQPYSLTSEAKVWQRRT